AVVAGIAAITRGDGKRCSQSEGQRRTATTESTAAERSGPVKECHGASRCRGRNRGSKSHCLAGGRGVEAGNETRSRVGLGGRIYGLRQYRGSAAAVTTVSSVTDGDRMTPCRKARCRKGRAARTQGTNSECRSPILECHSTRG